MKGTYPSGYKIVKQLPFVIKEVVIGGNDEYDVVKRIKEYSEKNQTKNELKDFKEVCANIIFKAVNPKKDGIVGAKLQGTFSEIVHNMLDKHKQNQSNYNMRYFWD